jgi:hypothetical protein
MKIAIINSLKRIKRRLRMVYFKIIFFAIKNLFSFVKKDRTLTCYSGNDGGGAQLQRILSVASLCKYLNIDFVYTKISDIDFHPLNYSKEEWIKQWNSLINFEKVYKINENNKMEVKGIFVALRELIRHNGFFAITNAHLFADSHPCYYNNLIESTGLSISLNHENGNSIQECSINASLHYRVPIVSTDHKFFDAERNRMPSEDSLCDTIEAIKKDNNLVDDCITIFLFNKDYISKDFYNYYPNITVDDNTNAIDAIRHMSRAEILLVSNSSMSYLAALFSRGIVYCYKNFWHSPQKKWRRIK